MGIERYALEYAASFLESKLVSAQSNDDEFTLDLTLGRYVGTLHDQCMPWFDNPDLTLVNALVDGILKQHAAYLESDHSLSGAGDHIRREFIQGSTLRIKSDPTRGTVSLKLYPANSGWITKIFATTKVF